MHRYNYDEVYSSTSNEVGTLAVDRWALTFGTATRGLGSPGASYSCTKCNSPPINGQCTNHRIDVRCSALLMWPSRVNYLSRRIVLRSQTDTCSGWEPRRLRHVGTRTCRRLHTSEPHGTTRRHVPIIVEQSLSHTARTPPTAVRNIASLSPQKTHTTDYCLHTVDTYLIKTL